MCRLQAGRCHTDSSMHPQHLEMRTVWQFAELGDVHCKSCYGLLAVQPQAVGGVLAPGLRVQPAEFTGWLMLLVHAQHQHSTSSHSCAAHGHSRRYPQNAQIYQQQPHSVVLLLYNSCRSAQPALCQPGGTNFDIKQQTYSANLA
jgi:hypothetical protein